MMLNNYMIVELRLNKGHFLYNNLWQLIVVTEYDIADCAVGAREDYDRE